MIIRAEKEIPFLRVLLFVVGRIIIDRLSSTCLLLYSSEVSIIKVCAAVFAAAAAEEKSFHSRNFLLFGRAPDYHTIVLLYSVRRRMGKTATTTVNYSSILIL